MSATLRAKHVLVMDADKIAIGQHTELLQRHALYADFHATWQTGSEQLHASRPAFAR